MLHSRAAELLTGRKQKKPDKKKILKALKILFGVLVVVFLAWYFWKNWDEFSDKIMNVDMGIFIFSMLFYFLYKITLASLWHYITKLNGCAIKYEKAVTSYLYSILGKYIPGKVFMLAARLTYYKEEDAPLSKVTVCFFIENVCTLLGAAMLFIVSLLFFPNELLENYKWVTIALIVVFFVCIHPKIINFFLRILGKLFKKDLEIPMKYSQMLKVVLLFIGNWLIVGVGFFILTKFDLSRRGVFRTAVLCRYLGSFRDNGHSRDIRPVRAWSPRGNHRSRIVPYNAAERRNGRIRGVQTVADYSWSLFWWRWRSSGQEYGICRR